MTEKRAAFEGVRTLEATVRSRRRLWMGLVVLAALALLPACGSSGASKGKDGVTRLTATSQANETGLPLWLADKLGYFKDNKLDVKIEYAQNGAAALAAGVAGDWQAGWTGAPPAITGWNKWGLISVGPQIKEDTNLKVLMRKDALAGSTPAQVLRSAKIGTVPNSTWSQVLYACGRHLGVDAKEMKIVPLEPPQVLEALKSKQVMVGTTSSSADYDLVKDKSTFEAICDGKMANTSVLCTWIVTPRFVKENPDAAAAFIEAVYRANEYINNNPGDAVNYMLEYYKAVGIDGSKEKAAYALSSRQWITLDQAKADMTSGTTQKALTDLANFFVAGGSYKEMPDVSGLVDRGSDVLETAVQLRSRK